MVCRHLDAVSISNLSQTNVRLGQAVKDFNPSPQLLVEDDSGNFSRLFNPLTQTFTPTTLAPMLVQHLDTNHPKTKIRRKRRIRSTDTGHPHVLTIHSNDRSSLLCTNDNKLQVMRIPIANSIMLPDALLRMKDFDFSCPIPHWSTLPMEVWDLYESFMMSDWGIANTGIESPTFNHCFWDEPLQVLVLHKHRKMWVVDPIRSRKILLPDFLDVNPNQRNQVDIENFVCQDGYLIISGDTIMMRKNDSVKQKKLFSFDLYAYVKQWREQSDRQISDAFTHRVVRLANLLEKYCASIKSLMEPHLLLNLSNLSFASQMNIMSIITVINTGIVVDAGTSFNCLGRVPGLASDTHFDRFPQSNLLMLRSKKSRYYLISTKNVSEIVAVRSWGSARSKSIMPHHPIYCADQRV